MPISPGYHIISRNNTRDSKFRVIMTHISKEEEDKLDNIGKGFINLSRGNRTFTVKAYQIYGYGEIDFNNADDLAQIKDFNFLSHLSFEGLHIPADYDYETHTCKSPIKKHRYTETWNSATAAKYAHGCLNKPKRIIIFKI